MTTITVFGSINIDLVVRVEAFAKPGETVLTSKYERHFGGKGANQAVAAARVLGVEGDVSMVGAVGEDVFGKEALQNLEENYVSTAHIAWVDSPTGCAFITVNSDGENSITVASGANSDVLNLNPPFANVALLQMEVPLSENLSFARAVKRMGTVVLLNLAPVPPSEMWETRSDEIRELVGEVDYLIVNELELKCLFDHLDLPPAKTPMNQTSALSNAVGCHVITTLGGDGAVLAKPEGGGTQFAPAKDCAIVDTTGAGDTFCGVFTAAIAEGLSPEEALVLGVKCASLACQSAGAQAGMPFRVDVWEQ